MIYGAQGKRAEALQIIKDLEGISGASLSQAHVIAKIHATLNEKEMALSWLERGLATGAIGVFYKDEPVWDPIRNDRLSRRLSRKCLPPLKRLGMRDEPAQFFCRTETGQRLQGCRCRSINQRRGGNVFHCHT